MEFGSGREGFHEEEKMGKGMLRFSYSSSSSPSSSSSQYKTQLLPLTNHGREPQIYKKQTQMGWWLGKYDPEEHNSRCGDEGASKQLHLMEASPENDNETRRGGDSDAASELRSASSVVSIEKEHMFDKVVTPSDVGKLNRLVIPKQQAEKYFPLDSSTNEKGLLLNFEDRNGKAWRFRYSYWNSSQSYVMTKGWSRFVKEKKLDAGDIVSFQRGVGESAKDRLYIDWRRRPPDAASLIHPPHLLSLHRAIPWSPLLMRPPPPPVHQIHNLNRYSNYGTTNVVNYPCSDLGSVYYMRSAAPQQQPMVFESVPVVHGKAAAKRLRLFGVNMECPISESDDECDILSSTTIQHATMSSRPVHLSASSQNPPQLRLYNGMPMPAMPANDFLNRGKASMSLDFDV